MVYCTKTAKTICLPRTASRRVLEYDPNNARAELYLKDIDATKDMYYDEDSVKQEQKLQQLLSKTGH